MKRLINATIHSLRGLRYTVAHEVAVRQEAIVLAFVVLLGFFVAPSPAWYVAMIGVLLLLLAVELLNTAIERLSDHVTPEHQSEESRMRVLLPCSACWCSPGWYGLQRLLCA